MTISAQPSHTRTLRRLLPLGKTGLPWTVAAPSFVWPDTAAENCRRLAQKYPEVGILLFEGESCLNYTDEDLSPDLADLDMRYHTHMPLDLPWEDLDRTRKIIHGLIDKTSYLEPWAHVMHVPPDYRMLDHIAAWFREKDVRPCRVLIENTGEFDPLHYLCDMKFLHLGMCLDLGHLLKYGQERLLDAPGVWGKVRMVHLSAPGHGGRHECISELDGHGRRIMRKILSSIHPNTVVMIELFNPVALESSLAELQLLSRQWGLA